jgi:tetratricopeptide (TPR) repeat protein
MLQSAVAATSQGALVRTLSLVDRVLGARSGTGRRAEAFAVRAYALSRAGRHDEALAAAQEEVALLTRIGSPQVATAVYDVGSLALAAGRHLEAVSRLSEALSADSTWFPRALARLRLAEARLHTGDATGAASELERFPYEPVGPADLPETLVPLLERVQALVAAAEGDPDRARRLFDAAVAGWRRLRDTAPQDTYAASLIELGRSAVAGRLEPGLELSRTLADFSLLLGANGEADRARALAREAATLTGTGQ